MQQKRSVLRVFATALTGLIVAGTVLTACNKFDNDDNINSEVAGLMAFNLAPDQSAVTVALSGSALTNVPLTYTSYTGVYLRIYPGSRTVEAYDNTNTSPIASQPFSFETKKYYSAFVAGANGNYRNIVVWDNFDSLSATNGKAYIRYINAIPDSSAAATVKISAGGSDAVNETAPFGKVGEFREVTPGQVVIDVNNGGSIDADRTITVEDKKVYTVLLTGIPGSGSAPVQIRFIENGKLDDESGSRTSTSARSANIN